MVTVNFNLKAPEYEICYQAAVLSTHQITRADWPDVVSLIKKLRQIGVPAEQNIGQVVLYNLNPSVETSVQLERSELRQLRTSLASCIWHRATLEAVLETDNWLASLPES